MLIWEYTRNIAISIIKYFIAVTFLQVIVVAIIGAGMIALDIVNYLSLPAFIPMASSLPALVLIVVLVMSFFASAAICFGPFVASLIKIIVYRRVVRR
jgi:hypothetical protein